MNVSAEEDADLRDLVAYTLESNGILGKIKVECCTYISSTIVRIIKLYENWIAAEMI